MSALPDKADSLCQREEAFRVKRYVLRPAGLWS